MYHFHFIERNTGEEFIVGAYDGDEAYEIAQDVGKALRDNYGLDKYDVRCIGMMSDDEAEMSGLDEY